jgi:transketolase
LNAIAAAVPELIGGSADLSGSNLTIVKDAARFTTETPEGRNIHFGIREHGMGAIMNGMALHGGVIPYGGTFLVFADYMRPAIRLAALMRVRAIYVFTHDSIGLGEDGPTHQPIEHLAALRCIPNLLVLRPADADEVAAAWRLALHHRSGPVAIALTRQKVSWMNSADRVRTAFAKGAYVLAHEAKGRPDVVLMATGSEVEIALAARDALASQGLDARVVSAPCLELFAAQPEGYRDEVLPRGVRRVAVEAAHPASWYRYVAPTDVIVGLDHFGASAPAPMLYREFGITVDAVVRAALPV